jgi:hypothetical protein
MYGPGGPGYGSGLGFNGFGMNDPWTLYKQYYEEKALAAADPAKAPAPKGAGDVNKSTNATVQAKEGPSPAGTNVSAGPAKAPAPKGAGDVNKSTNVTGPAKGVPFLAGTNVSAG